MEPDQLLEFVRRNSAPNRIAWVPRTQLRVSAYDDMGVLFPDAEPPAYTWLANNVGNCRTGMSFMTVRKSQASVVWLPNFPSLRFSQEGMLVAFVFVNP